MITHKDGTPKEYIFKSDIRRFLRCNDEMASEIFDMVKDLERETYRYEMFKNRVPQELFHKLRRMKK